MTLSGAGEFDPDILRYTRDEGTHLSEKGCIPHILNVGSKEPKAETVRHSDRRHGTIHDHNKETTAIAGGSEVTDTVSCVTSDVGDEATTL